MAFAIKASPSSSPSSSPVPLPLPRRVASMGTMTGRRRAVAAVRVVATAAAAAPSPGKPAGAIDRCLPVSQTLARLMAKGKTAFIPYITAGDPNLATTAEALRLLDACGADVIELGVPFSDPYADGRVIQASTARALAGGVTPDGVLAMLKEVTPELSCPVVLFSYFNPIVRQGLADFAAAVKEAGVHGLIVPDLPYVATCVMRSEAMKKKPRAGAAYNASYTSREDEGNHKSFRRICLSGDRQWSYRSPCKRELPCGVSYSGG